MSVVQIAAQAGVSIATVSRVLNNSRRVNPKLAEQVHRAMVELKFDPQQIRRKGPRRSNGSSDGHSQQQRSIAIISLGQRYRGWFEIPVIAAVVAEIMRTAQEHHLQTFVNEIVDPATSTQSLRRQRIDGALVFISSDADASVNALLRDRLPMVRVMGGQMAQLEIDHVGPDNGAIGHLAGQYLIQQGCRDLVYLTTRPWWDMSKLRGHGFASAALSVGCRPHVFAEGDASNLDCLYGTAVTTAPDLSALVALVANSVRARPAGGTPLGLFVSRDEETVAVYRLLAEQGLQPGRDLVIVSCDNEDLRLSALHPRPASIDLNAAQIARHGVERLLDRMRNPQEPPVRMLVNPRLGLPRDEAAR